MKTSFSFSARKELFRLPEDQQIRIVSKIKFYARQDDPLLFAKHIGGKIHRFRIGDYRILFEIKDGEIQIAKIERRDKAYK